MRDTRVCSYGFDYWSAGVTKKVGLLWWVKNMVLIVIITSFRLYLFN